eukprot:jgi/Astpho2/3559/Aster-06469
MHHVYVEGNLHPKDLSSTEGYERDSFPQFIAYWLRYLLTIWVELPLYMLNKGQWRQAATSLTLEAVNLAGLVLLWRFNAAATLWVLLIPLVVSSFALMFGNWSQHIFIDPSNPRSPFGMTYNCVAFAGNQRSFNDGYHICHHANSRLHWSQLPAHFQARLGEHAAHQGLVFKHIGFLDIGLAVFLHRWAYLSSHVVRYWADPVA